jgi:hypothetical protein
MQIRRTIFGLGVFSFGVGIALSGVASGKIAASGPGGGAFLGAILSFLAAAVLLGWSFKGD